MNIKELCLSLAACETEQEVIETLKAENLWDKPEHWVLFGEEENNYATIGNQQSKPESAIVEKIINSVDAMLMGECLRKGINPESEEAPSDIRLALSKYFSIVDGKLTNLSSKERSKLSENILFIASGAKSNPTYTIIDKGEGQSPARLPHTILSTRKSNKLRIPFVQGKFNMGGTGVLRFCGKHNIQLVISRRNPEIAVKELDSTNTYWGFSIIRRDNPVNKVRSSSYKYLMPNNQPLFFEADELPLLPGEYPNPQGSPMIYGTFIKMFEYQIGPYKTNILFDLYNKLSLLMPNIALPIRLFERRKGYSGNSFETVLSGLSVRIEEDRSENIEDGFPTSGPITVMGEKMKYSLYVFKKGGSAKYTKDEGIIFTINGQTHGYLPKAFFNRKNVGMGYLADSILVILDCSEIDGRAREDLFMNSRDRLSNCGLKSEIESRLEDLLKNHEGLKFLKEKRRKEEIENKLQDSKPLVDILQDILKKSPSLSRIFLQGVKLHNPFSLKESGNNKEFIGKFFPSIFSLSSKYPNSSPKAAHLGSRFRIQYKTDVLNDYFDRSKDPGSFTLYLNDKEIDNFSVHLWNGYATLNVTIEECNIGDMMHFKSVVNDVSRTLPFEEDFFITVDEPLKKGNQDSGNRRKPSSNDVGNNSKNQDGFSLPNITEVSKDSRTGHGWDSKGFDQYSALKVIPAGENVYDFFVNIDNIHLLTELKNIRSEDIKVIESKYKFGLVLVGIALINENLNPSNNSDEEFDITEYIYKITKAVSPIILPMIDSLSALELEELVVASSE